MEDLDVLISLFGWFALTYYWLNANLTFVGAIAQAIENHNNAIRQEVLQRLKAEDEAEEQPENES